MSWTGSGAGGSGAGGSGAGGSGAGGSGAGGSGAGGSGAGGSGAGGSGAGGHAGGPSSPLLNTALAITNDAVTGFWGGDADLTPQERPRNYADLNYLSAERRMGLLQSEILGRLKVLSQTQKHPVRVLLDKTQINATQCPDRKFFADQLYLIRNYSDLRVDRIPEIHIQITDLLSFFGLAAALDGGGRKHTLELLTVVQQVAYLVTQQVKHLCWSPRPNAYSRHVHPIIQTPDHSTFPSGHASEAFAIATVLESIRPPNPPKVIDPPMSYRIAHRIAVNRTIAGVHFPVDNYAGGLLGASIGQAIIAMLSDARPIATVFDPDGAFTSGDDFLLDTFLAAPKTPTGPVDDSLICTIYKGLVTEEWALASQDTGDA